MAQKYGVTGGQEKRNSVRSSRIDRLRILLRQAEELRRQVRENLAAQRFGSDDVQMKVYNDLAMQALSLLPNDPILGEMVVMPDGVLQSLGTLVPITSMPPATASERLEVHLTRLVNRLQAILGEPSEEVPPIKTAQEVLRSERKGEVQQILDALDELRRKQSELPPTEARDFDFVSDLALRKILTDDFIETQRAFAVSAFKASAILAGGLIEGMLLDTLRKPEIVKRDKYQSAVAKFPKVEDEINWDKVGLSHLLAAARDLDLIDDAAGRMAEGARDFRDTVHPNAELRQKIRAKLEEAELLLALVKLIYRQLSEAQ